MSGKILITTGIFEPEIGGPATYARMLGNKFGFPDGKVHVLTYADKAFSKARGGPDSEYVFDVTGVPRHGKIASRWRYFWKVMKLGKNVDIIYSLDWFAAGFPVALAARILEKPYVVRVGGDYQWEYRYMEKGKAPMSLSDFYENGTYKRYRFAFFIIRYVLRGAAHVIFNSDKQQRLYEKYYELKNTSVIYNPVPEMTLGNEPPLPEKKEFVFWGRFVPQKNVDSLIRAFKLAKLPSEYKLSLIGDGTAKNNSKISFRSLGFPVE